MENHQHSTININKSLSSCSRLSSCSSSLYPPRIPGLWTLVTGDWSRPPVLLVTSQFLSCWNGPSPILLEWSQSCWSHPSSLVTSQFLSCWNGPSPAGHIPVPILLEWSQSCWSHPSSYPAGMVPVLLVLSCWNGPSPAGPILLEWSQSCWSYPTGMVPVLLVTSQFLSCWNGPSPAGMVPFLMRSHS